MKKYIKLAWLLAIMPGVIYGASESKDEPAVVVGSSSDGHVLKVDDLVDSLLVAMKEGYTGQFIAKFNELRQSCLFNINQPLQDYSCQHLPSLHSQHDLQKPFLYLAIKYKNPDIVNFLVAETSASFSQQIKHNGRMKPLLKVVAMLIPDRLEWLLPFIPVNEFINELGNACNQNDFAYVGALLKEGSINNPAVMSVVDQLLDGYYRSGEVKKLEDFLHVGARLNKQQLEYVWNCAVVSIGTLYDHSVQNNPYQVIADCIKQDSSIININIRIPSTGSLGTALYFLSQADQPVNNAINLLLDNNAECSPILRDNLLQDKFQLTSQNRFALQENKRLAEQRTVFDAETLQFRTSRDRYKDRAFRLGLTGLAASAVWYGLTYKFGKNTSFMKSTKPIVLLAAGSFASLGYAAELHCDPFGRKDKHLAVMQAAIAKRAVR